MADKFSDRTPGLDSPADYGADVLPDDNADLPNVARALYVGGAGNVSIITPGGSTLNFANVPAGFVLPWRAKRVRSTGTTATNIVAGW